jgi:hypothetical protein
MRKYQTYTPPAHKYKEMRIYVDGLMKDPLDMVDDLMDS